MKKEQGCGSVVEYRVSIQGPWDQCLESKERQGVRKEKKDSCGRGERTGVVMTQHCNLST